MRIHNDGPDRIVLVGLEDAGDGVPFGIGTRAGDALADLLGEPVTKYFATCGIIPARTVGAALPRHRYGYDARDALCDRRAIVVGREAAALLRVPEAPLYRWFQSKWLPVEERPDGDGRTLPPIVTAAFPVLTSRRANRACVEWVEEAVAWLAEQGGVCLDG